MRLSPADDHRAARSRGGGNGRGVAVAREEAVAQFDRIGFVGAGMTESEIALVIESIRLMEEGGGTPADIDLGRKAGRSQYRYDRDGKRL